MRWISTARRCPDHVRYLERLGYLKISFVQLIASLGLCAVMERSIWSNLENFQTFLGAREAVSCCRRSGKESICLVCTMIPCWLAFARRLCSTTPQQVRSR